MITDTLVKNLTKYKLFDLKEKVFKEGNFEIEICDVNFYPLNLRVKL